MKPLCPTSTSATCGGLLILILLTAACRTPPPPAQSGASTPPTEPARKATFSSFDRPSSVAGDYLPAGTLNFVDADLFQVLDIYQELSGRAVVRRSNLPAARISLQSQQSLDRVGLLQLLDTVLAQNGIVMVLLGDVAVKAVPAATAHTESPPHISLPAEQLPESSSYMMRVVQTKWARPSELLVALLPLANLPNSVIAVDDANLLILRDYSSNIRQMLPLIEQMDSAE